MSVYSEILDDKVFPSYDEYVDFLEDKLASDDAWSDLKSSPNADIGWSDYESLHSEPHQDKKTTRHLSIRADKHYEKMVSFIKSFLKKNGLDEDQIEEVVEPKNDRWINILFR